MAVNMGKWPSKRGPTPKSGHWMAAEGMEFSWRWNGVTISLDLGVIWEMSVSTDPRFPNMNLRWSPPAIGGG